MKDRKTGIAINRCHNHPSCLMIDVTNEHGGTRITPTKCCGHWDLIKTWRTDQITLESLAELLKDSGYCVYKKKINNDKI
jgi:hypothetical protein